MTENSVFVCSICPDNTFTSFDELSSHMDSQHEPKSLEINRKMIIDNNFTLLNGSVQTLLELNNASLPKLNFSLPESNQVKYSKIKIIKKLKQSKSLPNIGDETNTTTLSKSNEFNSLGNVNSASHLRHPPTFDQTEGSNFTCSDCGKVLASMKNLHRHKLVHLLEKNFVCEFCGLGFKREDTLKDHRCIVDEKGLMARIKRTRNREEILDTQVALVCPSCGKSFANVSNLNKHLKIHEEKKEVCHECGKQFHMKVSLRDHITQIHKGGQILSCPVCQKELKGRNSLFTHLVCFHPEQKNRLGPPKHTCPDCGRVFRQRGNLKKHRLTHSETLNYICRICKKAFRFPEQLRRHVLKHDSKRHACDMCNRGFTLEHELKNHIDVFHGRMLYVCKYCHMSCKHLQAFKRHLHRQHDDRGEEWKTDGLTFIKSCRVASDHYVNVQVVGEGQGDSLDDSLLNPTTPPAISTNQLPETQAASGTPYFISDQLEEGSDDHLISLSSSNGASCRNYFDLNVGGEGRAESSHPSFVPHISDPIGFDAGFMSHPPSHHDDQEIFMPGSLVNLVEFITFPIPDGFILSSHDHSIDGS